MQNNTSDFLKQFGLALIGQALPDTSALSGVMSDIRRGLLATVITGMLISAVLLLGCFGFYQLLLTEGISPSTATGLSAGLLLLLGVISALVTEKYATKVVRKKEKLALFSNKKVSSNNNAEALLQAFLDGLCETEPTSQQPTNGYSDLSKAPPADKAQHEPVRH